MVRRRSFVALARQRQATTKEINRFVLADREAILVSSFTAGTGGRDHELGVCGRGSTTGSSPSSVG